MAIIRTYKLVPFLPVLGRKYELNTVMFREMVNYLVRKQQEALEKSGADVSLFFNHDPDSGKTRIGYPLIIYHFFDGQFYLTGINQGAHSIGLLAGFYKKPFRVNGILFNGFRKTSYSEPEFNVKKETKFSYRLIQWIPLHHKDYPGFELLAFTEKAKLLNEKLSRHIDSELGKYLELNLENLEVELSDIRFTYREPILYKKYRFRAYDIEFKSNLELPGMITLGNIKSLGYGRIEII